MKSKRAKIFNIKNNNKGFSLVEVLVAIAILGIVTIPLLKAFTTSAVVNRNARRTENANAVATAYMEEFKSLSVKQLLATYPDSYTYNSDSGKYEFDLTGKTNSTGANNEKFDVKVVLDPTQYRTSTKKVLINDYLMPNFTELDKKKNFVSFDDLAAADSTAQTMLGKANRAGIKKTITINVTLKYSGLVDGTGNKALYKQTTSANVLYESGSDKYELENVFLEEKLISNIKSVATSGGGTAFDMSRAARDVYFFITPYDWFNSEEGMATDKIVINYNYYDVDKTVYGETDSTDGPNLYLVQQESRATETSDLSILNKEKVIVNQNFYGVGEGEVVSTEQYLNVYSNISGWGDEKTITVNGKSKKNDFLYNLSVMVDYDGENLVNTRSTKEN